MAARASCSAIITHVRTLSGVVSTDVSDDQIQTILDQGSDLVQQLKLNREENPDNDVIVKYTSPLTGWWESDYALTTYDSGNNLVTFTPSIASDATIGVWIDGVVHPNDEVFITGRLHHVNDAVISCIQIRLIQLSAMPDFVADGLTVNRSAATKQLSQRLMELQALGTAESVTIYRGDT